MYSIAKTTCRSNILEKHHPKFRFSRTTGRTSLFAVQLLFLSASSSVVAFFPPPVTVTQSAQVSKYIINRNSNSFNWNKKTYAVASTKSRFAQSRSSYLFATSRGENEDIIPSVIFQTTERGYHTSISTNMPRGVKKENLPSKICVTCGRPFTWRKKWERVWDEVTTCSKSCNRKRREAQRKENGKSGGKAESDDFVLSETEIVDEVVEEIENLDVNSAIADMEKLAAGDGRSDGSDISSVGQEDASSIASLVESDEDIMNIVAQLEQNENSIEDDPVARRKAERKAAKKAKKAERRAQREGRGDPSAGQKQCDMCSKSVNLLIRCTYDKSGEWKMVCGSCWKIASGGVVDGDAAHPHYRYGGLWKNRRAQK